MGQTLLQAQQTESEFDYGAKQDESEIVSSTEESAVLRPTAKFNIADMKDYDIAEKLIH